MQIGDMYISSGKADKVLLVSAVSGVDNNNGACMSSLDDVNFQFAGLTVAVVATANDPWAHHPIRKRPADEHLSQVSKQPGGPGRNAWPLLGHSVRASLFRPACLSCKRCLTMGDLAKGQFCGCSCTLSALPPHNKTGY